MILLQSGSEWPTAGVEKLKCGDGATVTKALLHRLKKDNIQVEQLVSFGMKPSIATVTALAHYSKHRRIIDNADKQKERLQIMYLVAGALHKRYRNQRKSRDVVAVKEPSEQFLQNNPYYLPQKAEHTRVYLLWPLFACLHVYWPFHLFFHSGEHQQVN